jgi:MoxR-like ATPase
MFYPAFVTGLSGNGKTTMIDQICAKLGRELFRVNITALTDEDDLLGGMRLIDGDMAWVDGPVVAAMKRGAVLLLDEIDLASHAIMCLQPVLEGKGVFLKKTGQWVRPAAGFQVFATANTKGQGDDTGKFVATNVLNEAFLDRFPVCVEQDYPDKATEKKIVTKVMEGLGCLDRDFAKRLVDWADTIRTCYREGGVDEIVTTRRVVNICTAFAVFGDRMKAIRMGVTRFDASTQEAFITMYEKIDSTVTTENEETAA